MFANFYCKRHSETDGVFLFDNKSFFYKLSTKSLFMDTVIIPGYKGGLFVPQIEFMKDPFWIGKSFLEVIDTASTFIKTDSFEIHRRVPVSKRPVIDISQFLFGVSYLVNLQKEGQPGFLCLDGMTSIGPIHSPFQQDVLLYVHMTFFKEDLRWKCSLRDVKGVIVI